MSHRPPDIIQRFRRRLGRLIAGAPSERTIRLQEQFPQYQIGRGSYGDLRVHTWGEGAVLKMGAFCSVAAGVQVFLGGEHRTEWVTTFPFSVLWPEGKSIAGHPKTKGDVVIGNDVWIGTEAIIMSGLHIGDGAVIGARAVVTKSVPPYAIVAGNPASILRSRFAPETVEALLRIRWWDWPDEKIRAVLPLLCDSRPDQFIARASDASDIEAIGG